MDTCIPYTTLVEKFVLAQQHFEGWALPGQSLNGKVYPRGTRSYQNNNPCNFRTGDADPNTPGIQPKPYMKSLGAIGADAQGFCVFPSYSVGLAAAIQFLNTVLANQIIPYRQRAQHLGLANAGALSILQYFEVYAPSNDNNYPAAYAAYVAHSVGLLVTDAISQLTIPRPGALPDLAEDFIGVTKVDASQPQENDVQKVS